MSERKGELHVRRRSWRQHLSLLSLTALLLWAAAPAAAQELNDLNQRVISEFRANQGKVGGRFANIPVLLLTTTGAKSGGALTRPLAYTTDGDRLVVIASFGGGPRNPSWYHNLVANPVATVELGSDRFQVRATVTSGEERQRLFDRQAKQMPNFAEYQKKTTRQIPVIVLTRID
jgi:deazaflavin-dependent oxidoreductase (nitroreductase family)